MALIPVYHAIADYYPLYTPTAIQASNNNDILAGQLLQLETDGTVRRCSDVKAVVIGVAGDSTIAPTAGNLATQNGAALIMGGISGGTVTNPTFTGFTSWTQNRVSDLAYNETRASNKVTVYHGGGKFWTDQYETLDTFVIGAKVYVSATGKFSSSSANSAVAVGVCFASPTAYPSGVPGTETIDGSMSLGTFLGVILTIV